MSAAEPSTSVHWTCWEDIAPEVAGAYDALVPNKGFNKVRAWLGVFLTYVEMRTLEDAFTGPYGCTGVSMRLGEDGPRFVRVPIAEVKVDASGPGELAQVVRKIQSKRGAYLAKDARVRRSFAKLARAASLTPMPDPETPEERSDEQRIMHAEIELARRQRDPKLTPDQRARLDAWLAEQVALRAVKEEIYAAMQKPWHVRLWKRCTDAFEVLVIAGVCIRAGWLAAGALL